MSTTSGASKKSVPLSLIGKCFNLVFNLILLAFFAWMLLLMLAVFGILCFGWQTVWEIFGKAIEGMTSHLWIAQLGLESIMQKTDTIVQLPSSIAWMFPADAIPITKLAQDGAKAWVTFLLVTQFVIQRCQIFVMELLGMIAFVALGFIDGLVQRDIRKFQNARESTLIFHRSKSFLISIFFIGYFVFVVVPLEFDLSLYLVIMAAALGYMVQVVSRQFKKHL
ncbi:MAG: hypothetical protein K0S08_655 [Gammaproteobacteria bacterium]|jgi:hypothetical protein|nr:hypothetical protein [Gammaproteobacteria bacterium]